jgi:hypothetical protein
MAVLKAQGDKASRIKKLTSVLLLAALSATSAIAATKLDSVATEVQQEVRLIFMKTWSHCGSEWYGFEGDNSAFVEFKSPNFSIISLPISPVDRLNGIEWQGDVTINPVGWRSYDAEYSGMPTHTWTTWSPGVSSSYHLVKTNGEWSKFGMDGEKKISDIENSHPSCGEIPQ